MTEYSLDGMKFTKMNFDCTSDLVFRNITHKLELQI